MKKKIMIVSVAVFMCLVLTACRSGADELGTTAAETKEAEPDTTTTVAETEAEHTTDNKEDVSKEPYQTEEWNLDGVSYRLPLFSYQEGYGNAVLLGEHADIILMVAQLYQISADDLGIDLADIKTKEDILTVVKEPICVTMVESIHESLAEPEDFTFDIEKSEEVTLGECTFIRQKGLVSFKGYEALSVKAWQRKYVYYATQMKGYHDMPVWILCMDCSEEQTASLEEMEMYAQNVCKSMREENR